MIKKIIAINIFTFLCMLLLSVAYPVLVWGIAQLSPNSGKGEIFSRNGKTVGYQKEGQSFTTAGYFWGRPSAVNYNGAGSGGSNKGPTNPEYLKEVQTRIDTFLIRHPYLQKSAVPAEMVTASGSGLDPNISPESASVQIKRVAFQRNISEKKVRTLVDEHTNKPLLGAFGPSTINVLELNLALDKLQQTTHKK